MLLSTSMFITFVLPGPISSEWFGRSGNEGGPRFGIHHVEGDQHTMSGQHHADGGWRMGLTIA